MKNTTPTWIDSALTKLAYLNLDHVDGRFHMAAAILAAIPRDAIAEAVYRALREEPGSSANDLRTERVAWTVVRAMWSELER